MVFSKNTINNWVIARGNWHVVNNQPLILFFFIKWQWLRYTGPATVFSHQEVMNDLYGTSYRMNIHVKGNLAPV